MSSGSSLGLIANIVFRVYKLHPGCNKSRPFTLASIVHSLNTLSKYVRGLDPPPVVCVAPLKPLIVLLCWFSLVDRPLLLAVAVVNGMLLELFTPPTLLRFKWTESSPLFGCSDVWFAYPWVLRRYCSSFYLYFLATLGSTSEGKQSNLSRLQDMFSTVLV